MNPTSPFGGAPYLFPLKGTQKPGISCTAKRQHTENKDCTLVRPGAGWGQSPCPTCLDGDGDAPYEEDGQEQTGNNNNGGNTGTKVDPDNTYVYCTLEGKYYHSEKTCGGMRNAASVTMTWALEHNYKQCDDCDAPAAP